MANSAGRGWFSKKTRDEAGSHSAVREDILSTAESDSPASALAAFDAIVDAQLSQAEAEDGSHSIEKGVETVGQSADGDGSSQDDSQFAAVTQEEATFHVKQSTDSETVVVPAVELPSLQQAVGASSSVDIGEPGIAPAAIDWDAATHAALTEDVAQPISASTPRAPRAHLADEVASLTRRRQAIAELRLPLPDKTRVLTISNQKGGVGKTTTAVNLAAALARLGAKVLVIDLDPQGNASTALGVEHRADVPSIYNVIIEDLSLASVVQKSPEQGELYCVPANIHLAGAEIELVSLVAREQRLRRALDLHIAEMEEPYSYVFIDCPPSLGLLTINAFVAATEVLIPIQCEYYALEGLSQLLKNIEMIEKHLNPSLRVSTILLTMYDSRTNLANQVAQDVRDHFPKQVLDTIIPRSVRVSEAPSYGQSVISYDTNSTGSLSYQEAAAEMARRGTPTVTPRTGGQ